MDPIGAAASLITLIATIETAKECVDKIRRSLGAEGLVLELWNEASEFQVLIANVEAFNEVGTLSVKAQSAVQQSLLRATKAFNSFIEFAKQKLFTRLSTTTKEHNASVFQLPGARVSRTAWFFYEKEVSKYRDSLRQARESLHFALTVANTEIHLDLREVISSSQVSVQTKLAAHSRMVDDIRTMLQQMADQNAVRPRSPSASSDRTLRAVSSTDTLVDRFSSPPYLEDGPDEKGACHDASILTKSCPRSCSCTCHSTSSAKSPRWMNQVTGSLLMKYSGAPLLNSLKCSQRRCKERHQSKLNASYYFPSWMIHRMVEIAATWDANANPKMSIRVMRVIPDGSLLFDYAKEGSTAGIRDLFLQETASPIDIRESDGRSALHIALYYGHVSTAQFLLDQNSDRDYKDKYYQSAIGACWEISFQKLPIPTIDPCVIGGPTEYSDFLDERNLTSVHKIVLGISSVSLDEYLRLSTAEIDKRDVMGKTPLHFAAVRGDLDAVSTLIRHGADCNLTTDALWTPLHEAAISANHESLRLLLMAGSPVDALNNRGQNALALAAYVRDDPRYFDALVDYNTNIHLADTNGFTSLHRASVRNRVLSARRLIALGADVDTLDNKMLSPLHICVLNNSHDVLKVLLDSGARADRAASNGRTLLHDAAALGDVATIVVLSNALPSLVGLDPDAVDEDGRTPQEIFNCVRHTCVSENDEARAKFAFAFKILLDRLRDRYRITLLSEKLSEELEIQSFVSEDEFFEALDLMESSVESLHTLDALAAPLVV